MRTEDIQAASTRFLVRASRVDVGRLDTIRFAGKDYDIQYINDYNDEHTYQEILATHNLLRSTFLQGRLCTIYNTADTPVSAGKVKKITPAVQLLTAETEDRGAAYYSAGRTAEQRERTVRILRAEGLSTEQLCEVDGDLYQISEILQTTDVSGLLVTDLKLVNPGGSWRARYVR